MPRNRSQTYMRFPFQLGFNEAEAIIASESDGASVPPDQARRGFNEAEAIIASEFLRYRVDINFI